MWVLLCNTELRPAACLPTVSVITDKHAHIRPQLASLIRQPSLLMDFLPPPFQHQCDRPRSPPSLPRKADR